MTFISTDLTEYSKVKTGSYNGDDSVNRSIPHGIGSKPKVVIISGSHEDVHLCLIVEDTKIKQFAVAGITDWTVTVADSTNFYVGYGTGSELDNSCNGIGFTYFWRAWS